MKNRNTKNNAAFTGLEAAIVLIAFVVVAAVFSYVMLGAGFFTSQKSKEVVHTGVDQATSSIQLSGDVTGIGAANEVTNLYVTLSLTAGNNPVDTSKVVVSYKDNLQYNPRIFDGVTNAADIHWVKSNQAAGSEDNMLEEFEKVRLDITIPGTYNLVANTQFTIEVKPAAGAILPITLTTPPVVSGVMTLV
ncbi:archaellin/type IV pilin N-terminal domain-containing protein [Methanocella sp. MCL-LM]|uniref:archaellin/type IV pilin N-terminal domain-containing protein n=1 Tax=Methanocella sp. MCL-LM TaxID=3412035 RepID=UPI003C755614